MKRTIMTFVASLAIIATAQTTDWIPAKGVKKGDKVAVIPR